MAAPPTSPRVRALAAALRKTRKDHDVGMRELGLKIGISHSMISFWENGHRVPTPEDVAGFLAGLGVGGDEKERILVLARNATDPNWLTSGYPGMSPALAGVLDCETTATSITHWAAAVIPGLLQTAGYAKALLTAAAVNTTGIDPMVMMRVARRDILTRANPTRFTALIAEAAIREPIGTTEVQLEQLQHVLDMARRPNVDVQVVRSGQGWHPGLSGSFILFDFAESPSIIHIEHYSSSAFLYEDRDVSAYQAASQALRSKALDSQASVEFIASVMKELETK